MDESEMSIQSTVEIEFPVMRYDITMPLLEDRVPVDGVTLKPVKAASMINKEDPKLKAGDFGLMDLNIGYFLPAIEAGWEIINKTDKFYPPGYSIHEVGTCRMGDNPKTSVLNKWNQSHDIKNLFVVDGSGFVTCGWQNPTMTILSLSMRASEHLADQLGKRNL